MRELINSVSKKEWVFVGIITAVIIILTTVPYIFGYLMAPSNTVYNGIHALSPGDIPVYYSNINQVIEGDFLVKNLFTAEDQSIGTFNVWWFLVGLVAKIFGLSVILVFQLSRIFMIPVFIFISYLFVAYFIQSVPQRKISLIFILFSSGAGFWMAGLIDTVTFADTTTYWWPIDLWLTEAITFNALYQTSHFIASITLTLLIFLLMLLAFEKNRFNYAVISGFLALFYFNFHPYYLPVIFGVLGLYLFVLFLQASKILWRQMGYLVTVFLISFPSIIYHFWLIQASPVIGQRAVQNVTNISPLPFVLIGYGFLLPGFFLGLYWLIKRKSLNIKFIFLLIWLGLNVVLIYSPFPFHSRYTQGIQIIFSIFTVVDYFIFYINLFYQRLVAVWSTICFRLFTILVFIAII